MRNRICICRNRTPDRRQHDLGGLCLQLRRNTPRNINFTFDGQFPFTIQCARTVNIALYSQRRSDVQVTFRICHNQIAADHGIFPAVNPQPPIIADQTSAGTE